MSGKGELQKHLNKAKRQHEESLSADNITDSTPVSAKRQRKEPRDSMAGPTTSLSHTTNIPNTVLSVYVHMLPENPEGIAFLFGTRFSEALQVPAMRVAIQYQITKEDAIEELRRLLIIKAFTADIDANKISPTPLMDELWHAAILDTKLYAELQEALGLVLHHRPSGASDQESEHRERRLAVMKAIYRANFSTDPLGHPPLKPAVPSRPQPGPRLLNPISIFVMTLTGNKHTLTFDRQSTIDVVKIAIQSMDGISIHDQQLFYDGVVLDGGKTLERYGIGNESTLHLYTRPVGR